MKRKLFALILALVIFSAMVFSTQAADLPRLVDTSNLVKGQSDALVSYLDELSERLQFDFVVITVDDIGAMSPEDYANSVYDSYHYGYGPDGDGVLLLLAMNSRDWYITTGGSGQKYVNKAAREYIAGRIVPDLSAGNYYSAFTNFASLSAQMVVNGMEGHTYRAPFHFFRNLMIGFVISLLVGLSVVGNYKGELKSVKAQNSAATYVKSDSLQLTESREQYLYHQVTRTAKPKNTSTRSGGGSSHSGSGGKF